MCCSNAVMRFLAMLVVGQAVNLLTLWCQKTTQVYAQCGGEKTECHMYFAQYTWHLIPAPKD